ncbi:glutaredoxin domain-containing protein [Marinobacteraceae bacterium S3BR75-40.1]
MRTSTGRNELTRGRPFVRGLIAWLALIMATAAGAAEPQAKPTVVLFSQSSCPPCLAAKDYLEQASIDYQEYDIDESAKARSVFERLGGRGTPLLVVGRKVMHGFSRERFETLWATQAE